MNTPILLTTDQNSIDKLNKAVPLTMPLMQAIVDAWVNVTEFSILPAFTTEDLIKCINDPESFTDAIQNDYYQAKYGTAHSALGIGAETGMSLIEWPDYSAFENAVKEYNTQRSVQYSNYTSPESFTVSNNQVEVNQPYIDKLIENSKFYISTDKQLAAYAAINTLIDALIAADEVLRPMQIRLLTTNPAFGAETGLQNTPLNNIVDIQFDNRFNKDAGPKLSLVPALFRQLA